MFTCLFTNKIYCAEKQISNWGNKKDEQYPRSSFNAKNQ